MREKIYCDECGESENVTYLWTGAERDHYRCESCKEEFTRLTAEHGESV